VLAWEHISLSSFGSDLLANQALGPAAPGGVWRLCWAGGPWAERTGSALGKRSYFYFFSATSAQKVH
jgi:hypothetical protein